MNRYFMGIVAMMLFITGCARTHKFSTMGTEYQIAYFTDEGLQREHGELIAKELSFPLYFTHRESIFEVVPHDIASVGKFIKYKNIVFADDISTEDGVTVFLRDILGSDVLNNVNRISIAHQKDVWIDGQSVLFLLFNGSDYSPDEVKKAVQDAHHRLDEYIADRIRTDLEKEKVSKKAEEMGRERFGFPLLIPSRYTLFKESETFLSFVARMPDRLFFVAELPMSDAPVTMSFMIEARDALTEAYYGGDRIFKELYQWKKESPDVPYFGSFDVVSVDGRMVYKLTGLWENQDNVNGGPFITYLVEAGGKRYLLDAMLFYPSGNKWPFLNKLEASLKRTVQGLETGVEP
jgi:hypothetical protein